MEKVRLNHLMDYVGKKIIRIKPTSDTCDKSYTKEPVMLLGITPEGCIICSTKTCVWNILPVEFTDDNWVLYES